MSSDLVSILIPVYNAEPYLEQCLNSALNQSWANCQIIALNDGSTDRSSEILKNYSDQIEVIERENRGSNYSRNELSRLARGKWLQFLDADDYLLPEKIEQNLNSSSTADVIYGDIMILEAQSKLSKQARKQTDLYSQWLEWKLCQTGALLWKKEALDRIGGWNEAYPCCQDNEVCLRALQHGLEFHYDNGTAQTVYRMESENTLCRSNPQRTQQFKIELLREMLDWLGQENLLNEEHRQSGGETLFATLRMLAKTDLEQASLLEAELQQAGILHPNGTSAPAFYRLAYRLLGFSKAERLATILR